MQAQLGLVPPTFHEVAHLGGLTAEEQRALTAKLTTEAAGTPAAAGQRAASYVKLHSRTYEVSCDYRRCGARG